MGDDWILPQHSLDVYSEMDEKTPHNGSRVPKLQFVQFRDTPGIYT